MRTLPLACVVLVILVGTGCVSAHSAARARSEAAFVPLTEPAWIRDGEPVEYEGRMWYPTREVENLLDEEIYPVTELRGVQFYIDRTDIRPFQRLYTNFGKNRYRAFEPRRP